MKERDKVVETVRIVRIVLKKMLARTDDSPTLLAQYYNTGYRTALLNIQKLVEQEME
jgi:hypothetical protein